MDNLHREIILATDMVRKKLAAMDLGGSFKVTIEISGRIQDGEVKCEYRVGGIYGDGPTGHSLEPVLKEYMRRKGWEETNAPLALPAPADMYKTEEPVGNDPQPDTDDRQPANES